jgi:hypothetical protein
VNFAYVVSVADQNILSTYFGADSAKFNVSERGNEDGGGGIDDQLLLLYIDHWIHLDHATPAAPYRTCIIHIAHRPRLLTTTFADFVVWGCTQKLIIRRTCFDFSILFSQN